MGELFNRLGGVGLALIAGALIAGGLMGGAVVHRIDRGAMQPAASQQQGAIGDKDDNATKASSKSSSTSHKTTKPAPKKSTETSEKDSD